VSINVLKIEDYVDGQETHAMLSFDGELLETVALYDQGGDSLKPYTGRVYAVNIDEVTCTAVDGTGQEIELTVTKVGEYFETEPYILYDGEISDSARQVLEESCKLIHNDQVTFNWGIAAQQFKKPKQWPLVCHADLGIRDLDDWANIWITESEEFSKHKDDLAFEGKVGTWTFKGIEWLEPADRLEVNPEDSSRAGDSGDTILYLRLTAPPDEVSSRRRHGSEAREK
jgi:hypothetical protein